MPVELLQLLYRQIKKVLPVKYTEIFLLIPEKWFNLYIIFSIY